MSEAVSDSEFAERLQKAAASQDLYEAAKSIEWIESLEPDGFDDVAVGWMCPSCLMRHDEFTAPEERRHKAGCKLQAALAKAEGRS